MKNQRKIFAIVSIIFLVILVISISNLLIHFHPIRRFADYPYFVRIVRALSEEKGVIYGEINLGTIR